MIDKNNIESKEETHRLPKGIYFELRGVHKDIPCYKLKCKFGNTATWKRFKTLQEAAEYQLSIKEDVAPMLVPSDIKLDATLVLPVIRNLMLSKGVTDFNAVSDCLYANLTPPNPNARKKLNAIVEEFLLDRKAKNVRGIVYNNYKNVLKNLIKNFGKKAPIVGDLSPKAIENFHNAKKGKGRIYYNKLLNVFFNWMIRKMYIKANPLSEYDIASPIKERKAASVLHVYGANRILEKLTGIDLMRYALLLLVGLRPCELFQTTENDKDTLKWEDIDFQQRTIHFRSSVTKTRNDVVVTDLPKRLWDILKTYPKDLRHGYIGCASYENKKCREQIKAILKEAETEFFANGGVLKGTQTFELKRDITRHSFASYGIIYLGFSETLLITRHSAAIFQRHYMGFSGKEDALKYFEGMSATLPQKQN